VAEQIYSAVDVPFTLDGEREYLRSLTAREGMFLAETTARQVVGFQSVDQWTKLFQSMDHVGQLGTFVVRYYRLPAPSTCRAYTRLRASLCTRTSRPSLARRASMFGHVPGAYSSP
jgi:hypothetical protein